ncbi:NAD(P)/FAD-dependent oxidoreductase [Staphylococcus canis]|uniref:FAD-dependent oxidoreductase n=1 Tax=Staphylococcus canis TaxID=2724942 RepID=A0ABS0TBV6_9STAP|nr:FAD-dependent oxidoreductase [Staphylococcus canis]MBI5976025.1 FAD-dependent oxidoreductase [Staphylococcus canis]
MVEKVVIVGASIAGSFATSALRRNGFEGDITLISAENTLPYDKPPLSKEWMQDKEDETPPKLKKDSYYENKNINLELGVTIKEIQPDSKVVVAEDGREFPYDKLLLATGMSPRKLSTINNDLEGVLYLRTFEDALTLKRKAKQVKSAVVVGGGFVGLEIAASLREYGVDVTVVQRGNTPLKKVVGEELGTYIKKLHEEKGVTFIDEDEIAEVKGDQRLEEVVTKGGKTIPAELLLIGIGATFNDQLKIDQLKAEDQGYIINEYGETSLEDVFAAGDATIWPFKGEHIHVEHWENAFNQGKSVAKNIIEPKSNAYNVVPYFWSDQYDENFEYVGHAVDWHDTKVEGDFDSGKFAVTYYNEKEEPLAVFWSNGYKDRDEVEALLKP